jgi:DNA-binding transcriptional MocR family regulator
VKKLTPACTLLLFSLKRKYRYFNKKSRLSEDGSFFYSDKNLMKELSLSINTIKRAKRLLGQLGYIKIIPGKHEGVATKYWLLIEPSKMIPSNIIKEDTKMIPSKLRSEGPNLAQEGPNLVARAIQNDTPIKEITKKITIAAGSASACPNSQASPAFPIDAYKGHKILTQTELELLIEKYGESMVDLIVKGEVTLVEGLDIKTILDNLKKEN